MKSPLYIRRRNVLIGPLYKMDKDGEIQTIANPEQKTFNSVAQAKKASHKIQMDADKALGRGTVRVKR